MKRKSTETETKELGHEEEEDTSDDTELSSDENDELYEGQDEKLSEPEDQTHGTEASAAKKPRKDSSSLTKPLTNAELNQLKEAENLFHSSLFRLQITELLQEVCLRDKQKRRIEQMVKKLKEILLNIPQQKEHDLKDQKWLPKKVVKVPLIQIPKDVKGKFQFLTPRNIRVVGSVLLGTCVKPDVHADIMVEMPKECFQAKDHLNHRYLRKRALYLAFIAQYLTGNDAVENLHFLYHHGNHFKPILVVQMKDDGGKSLNIHLHVKPEEGVFRLNRFHIGKNNVRKQWFSGETDSLETKEDSIVEAPTPFYNTAILQDITANQNLECMLRAQEDSYGVKEGIALLKVWLHQREVDVGYGGFTGFIMSMYVVYLLSKKKLNKMMSSYQVMRNTLLHLAQADWTTDGISLCADNTDPNRPLLSEFHDAFDVVFVDITGHVNVCSCMNKSIFLRVRHEANMAIQMLENMSVSGFEMLFMTPVPFIRTFDHIFHIRHMDDSHIISEKLNVKDKVLDHGGNLVPACLSSLMALLEKALGKRATLIQIRQLPPSQWSVSVQPPSLDRDRELTFGLLLNTEFSTSVLDKGPPADSPQAKDFRQFWGQKSELRRFRDGSICEAAVWLPETTVAKKRLVCSKIIPYILERHAGIAKQNVVYNGGQLDSLLSLPVRIKNSPLPYGTGEEQHQQVIQSYDSLTKILRSLTGLPLMIHSVQGVHPVFRFAEVFPPLPATFEPVLELDSTGRSYVPNCTVPCPPWTPTLTVLCLLAGSGKWPENREAFRRLKAAFNIQMAELLTNQHSLTVKLGTDSVDIKKDGFVFRVKLAYAREIAILKMIRTQDGMLKMRDTEDSVALQRDIISLPKLSSTLHGIQQQHNTFSGTVRLAKRWVSAHLLLDHIREEAVELIVTQLYLCPAPYTPPGSPLVGFLRFLTFLATFDWKIYPLLVNLNDEFTKEDFTTITSKFTKERSMLPLMFISTPQDKYSSHWTKKTPTAPILNRLVVLAQESSQVLQTQVIGEASSEIEFKQIFLPPLDIYDVIIHLRVSILARQHQAVDCTAQTILPTYGEHEDEDAIFPVMDFDPVQLYLEELRAAYDDYAMFFHDRYGGNIVAVLWKPQTFKAQDFKVGHIAARMPQASGDKDVQMIPNVEAIIQDFRILGGGLVSGIQSKTDQWKI